MIPSVSVQPVRLALALNEEMTPSPPPATFRRSMKFVLSMLDSYVPVSVTLSPGEAVDDVHVAVPVKAPTPAPADDAVAIASPVPAANAAMARRARIVFTSTSL